MTFKINGSSMSLAPTAVQWQPIKIGTSHERRTIYSGDYNIRLAFDESAPTCAAQWINAVSSGSVNATILDRLALTFTDLSAVQFDIVTYPTSESIYVSGFELQINGEFVS